MAGMGQRLKRRSSMERFMELLQLLFTHSRFIRLYIRAMACALRVFEVSRFRNVPRKLAWVL